jgi:hypothetical protein
MKLVLLLVAAVAGSAAASEVAAEVKESAALRSTLRAMAGTTCTPTNKNTPGCYCCVRNNPANCGAYNSIGICASSG